MTVTVLLTQTLAEAAASVRNRFTYEDIAPDLGDNGCPYLGHVPFFAPKLTSCEKERFAGSTR